MKNIRKIEPVDVMSVYDGRLKKAEAIKFEAFHRYNFDDDPGSVRYQLCAINRVTTDIGLQLEFFETLVTEDCPLPAELVNQWGEDDEPIIAYVMNTLKLTPLPPEN